MMLKATGLIDLVDPEISEPARKRNVDKLQFVPTIQGCDRPINDGNHLAADKEEAKWLTAHFDMLFPNFYLESQLSGIKVNEQRPLRTKELIIIDSHHHVIWSMVVSLHITKIEDSPPPKPKKQFIAIPNVAVTRMEYKCLPDGGPQYPFKPPDHEMPATSDEDTLSQQMKGKLNIGP